MSPGEGSQQFATRYEMTLLGGIVTEPVLVQPLELPKWQARLVRVEPTIR